MIKINKENETLKYVIKYSMENLFTKDMKPFMELFFYKKNEHMVKGSEEISHLLFLVKGKAKVYTSLSNGRSLLLCFYEGFMVLGDLEIIDSQQAVTNVQAIEDTYCIGISYENVRKHLLEDAKFLRFICSSLGSKLDRCSNNNSINLLYSLENRLASYIYTTGERSTDVGATKIIFRENLTEIAELLGTSYRHLLRTLNTLCQKGVLKKNNYEYEVINEKILIKLSADLYR